jgi:hypothetical protein
MTDFSPRRAGPPTWHRGQVAFVLAAVTLFVLAAVGLILQGTLRSSSGSSVVHTALTTVARSQLHQPQPATTTWTFTTGLPSGWSVLTKSISTTGGVLVGTTETAGYQLVSPGVFVGPGRYRISVTLRILSGGIGLEALDMTRQHFLVNRLVAARDGRVQTVTALFPVYAPGNVFVVLSNATAGTQSSWMLLAADVRRSTPGP